MGSTSEKRCFTLTSCNPSTANQNMHAYGIMLIAGLSTLLLIIYNCSDQVLTTRERRLAKSREAAARSKMVRPGRITAVMGPSGAGKTTFLSALAGKAIGCSMTGLILINGKNISIHSYKKNHRCSATR